MGGKTSKLGGCVPLGRHKRKKYKRGNYAVKEQLHERLRRDIIFESPAETRISMKFRVIEEKDDAQNNIEEVEVTDEPPAKTPRYTETNDPINETLEHTALVHETTEQTDDCCDDARIGNSIEILDCPEMSTIAMAVGQVQDIEHYHEDESVFARTPSGPQSLMITDPDGQVVEEYWFTQTSVGSLFVPPNSLNSEYMSGICPLESYAHDSNFNCSSDSVFVADPKEKQIKVPVNHFRHNSLISPGLSSTKKGKFLAGNSVLSEDDMINNNSLGIVNGSDGPGLDSDFGASAGIEMRIVSTDYSVSDQSNSATEVDKELRKKARKIKQNRPSPRLQMVASNNRRLQNSHGKGVMVIEHPGTPIVYTPMRHFGGPPNRRKRAATIGGPVGLSTQSMEWDPYDTHYGANNRIEYFLPGVAFPRFYINPPPLLCDKQYWL